MSLPHMKAALSNCMLMNGLLCRLQDTLEYVALICQRAPNWLWPFFYSHFRNKAASVLQWNILLLVNIMSSND